MNMILKLKVKVIQKKESESENYFDDSFCLAKKMKI